MSNTHRPAPGIIFSAIEPSPAPFRYSAGQSKRRQKNIIQMKQYQILLRSLRSGVLAMKTVLTKAN